MSEKQFKVVVLPMSWLEWNETGMLREHFPNINLIEGRDETSITTQVKNLRLFGKV